MTKKEFLEGAKFRINDTFPTIYFYKNNAIFSWGLDGSYCYKDCDIDQIFKSYFTVKIKGFDFRETQTIPFESLVINSIPIKEDTNE